MQKLDADDQIIKKKNNDYKRYHWSLKKIDLVGVVSSLSRNKYYEKKIKIVLFVLELW